MHFAYVLHIWSAFRLTIVPANQIKAREILLRVDENNVRQTNCLKRGKAQVIKTPLLLVSHLIGREEVQVL